MKSLVGKNIIYIRSCLGLGQTDFGKLFDLSRDNIASYERGTEPKLITLTSIVNYFHLTLDDIVHRDLESEGYILDKNQGNKMVPKMVPNMVPNSNKSKEYREASVLNEPAAKYHSSSDLPNELFIWQQELLEERERTIYALNEVINSQKDALQSQKDLIQEYKRRIEDHRREPRSSN